MFIMLFKDSLYASHDPHDMYFITITLQDQPFTQKHPEALFNMALFLYHLDNNASKKFKGVSKVYPFCQNEWWYSL